MYGEALQDGRLRANGAVREDRYMSLIIGNWKMNGLKDSLGEARAMAVGASELPEDKHQLVICPASTLLMALSQALKESPILVGAQDCHPSAAGAHTGRISAEMIADAGATYCIIGHSECRDELGDDDTVLGQKVEAVMRAGLVPIFCVGESLEIREAGHAETFVNGQLNVVSEIADRIIVAYEPIWAIGTGRVPTTDDIASMHGMLRDTLGKSTPLLYGGSVKPSNASEILGVDHVNGALVGGASLKAEDFLGIANAAP